MIRFALLMPFALAGKAAKSISPIKTPGPLESLRDKLALSWTFDATKPTFYTPESVDLSFKSVAGVPILAKLRLKKSGKFDYGTDAQCIVGSMEMGRVIIDQSGLAAAECKLPLDFVDIEPRIKFPEMEPEVSIVRALSDRAAVKLVVPFKKRLKLKFAFDVDKDTTLGIEPLLGESGKKTKLTIDRKFDAAKVSATLYDKTATLAATYLGLKPSIAVNLDEPFASKPSFALSWAFST